MPSKVRSSKQSKKVKTRPPTYRGQARDTAFTYQPPLARRIKLTWQNTKILTEAAATAGAVNTFKLNSVYDVDDSFASTSTPGFAEWSAFFANYRVWEASVRVEGVVSGGSTGACGLVCVFPNATNTFIAALGSVAPMGVKKVVRADAGNGGPNAVKLQKRFSNSTVFRITPAQYAVDMDFSAGTAANPSRISRFGVSVLGINSTTALTFGYIIWVEMLIEFFNPYIFSN